jgi:anti-sigma factor RsiW
MNCEHWGPLLSQYVDGELTGAERTSVEEHLESCAACREELASFRELSRMLSTRTEPDPFFVSRFRARRDELMGGDATWLFWRRLAVRLMPLAAAALLAAAAVVLLSEKPGLEEIELQAHGDGIIVDPIEEPFQMHEIAFESLPEGEQ